MIIDLANIILIDIGVKSTVIKNIVVDGLKVSWDSSRVSSFTATILETGEVFTSETDSFDFSDKGIIYPVFTVKITPNFPGTRSKTITLKYTEVGIGYSKIGTEFMIGYVKPIKGVGFMVLGNSLIVK